MRSYGPHRVKAGRRKSRRIIEYVIVCVLQMSSTTILRKLFDESEVG